VKASDRWTAELASILSIVLGLWGLAVMPIPFGVVGGSGAALFGLVLGVLALVSGLAGRSRKTAIAGVAVSSLALVVAAAEVVLFAFSG
jgi:hypothetical protein